MDPPESPLTMDPCVAHVCQTNHMWDNPCIINSNNDIAVTITIGVRMQRLPTDYFLVHLYTHTFKSMNEPKVAFMELTSDKM